MAAPAEDEDPEAGLLAGLAGRARRDSAGLHLRLASGQDVLLADSGSEESPDGYTHYRLAAWHPRIHSYEVDVGYLEGQATLLVDGESGHRTMLWASPVVSPDGIRVAVTSMDLEAGFDPNGVQVWRVGPDSLAREMQQETEWGPGDARWMDDSTVAVRASAPPSTGDTTTRCVLLVRRSGAWRLPTEADPKHGTQRESGDRPPGPTPP